MEKSIITNHQFINEISFTDKEVYFSLVNGIYCRLTYNGNSVFRLMANSVGRNGFNSIGACQSLAKYLGENVCDEQCDITSECSDGIFSVKGDGLCRVDIRYAGCFSLSFYGKGGNFLSKITDISAIDDEKIVVIGEMTDGNGVFGGGERFDNINKAGSKIDLYTADGWNNSATTYVAVPLFHFTNGISLFINRYEGISADFGKDDPTKWSIDVDNSLIDMYIYASGSINDAITGYSTLSGFAAQPMPWMNGVQVCRYAPDLISYENDILIDNEPKKNPDGVPAGHSVKTVLENFKANGMKPDAVIMEGWNYCNVSLDTDVGRQSKQELQSTIDYLHENGVKAMLYMRVGGIGGYVPTDEALWSARGAAGYKQDFLVKANVTVTEPDGTVKSEVTTRIPYFLGTNDNPDVGRSSDGRIKSLDFIDITNQEAMDWYFKVIWGQLIEMGVDGVKIDFCETMPDDGKKCGCAVTNYLWKEPDKIEKGTEHHAYPTYFISAFYRAMNDMQKKQGKESGFMVLSRGGGIGSQRSPYLWAGDQVRSFSKLDDQLMAVVNSGLSGIPYMTYDMAGYRYGGDGRKYSDTDSLEYESEVFARAVEMTAFMSNIQTHGTVRHAYELTEEAQSIYKKYINIHAALLPYIRKYTELASATGIPPVRHMVLKYPTDKNVYGITDEYMLGDGLLCAPIISGKTYERVVYLPNGNWKNLLTGETVTGGKSVVVKAQLAQIPLFICLDSEDCAILTKVFDMYI